MEDGTRKVKEFHEAFGLALEEEPVGFDDLDAEQMAVFAARLRDIAQEAHELAAKGGGNLWMLRLQLMAEELAEVVEAIANRDMPNLLQELCDVRYVLDGTILSLGLGGVYGPALGEIHRANMSKLDEDGRPIINEAGRVVKSSRFRPADMSQFLDVTTCKSCGELDQVCVAVLAPLHEETISIYECRSCGNRWPSR